MSVPNRSVGCLGLLLALLVIVWVAPLVLLIGLFKRSRAKRLGEVLRDFVKGVVEA